MQLGVKWAFYLIFSLAYKSKSYTFIHMEEWNPWDFSNNKDQKNPKNNKQKLRSGQESKGEY